MDQSETPARLRLAELLAALSVVTDLGHGQPAEAAMRTCLLATRLAQQMQLGTEDVADIYYATLLRYVGCTAYAHEEAAMFGGDEIDARAAISMVDLGNPRELLSFGFFKVGRNATPLRRHDRSEIAVYTDLAADGFGVAADLPSDISNSKYSCSLH